MHNLSFATWRRERLTEVWNRELDLKHERSSRRWWDRSRMVKVHADQADPASQRERRARPSYRSHDSDLPWKKVNAATHEDTASLPVHIHLQCLSWLPESLRPRRSCLNNDTPLPLSDKALAPHIQIWACLWGLLPQQHHHHQVPQQPSPIWVQWRWWAGLSYAESRGLNDWGQFCLMFRFL